MWNVADLTDAVLRRNARIGTFAPVGVRVLRPYRRSDGALLADHHPITGGLTGWVDGTVTLLADALPRPKIVCLCGSTRFYEEFQRWNYEHTMQGNIVLSVGFYPHAQDEMHGGTKHVRPEDKVKLDELHKRKIDLADEIFVINVGGYIGESTRSEINYALAQCKVVSYLEPV